MDFAFSAEQMLLRAAARSWLADKYPAARVARLADHEEGWDPGSWGELVALGWLDPDLGILEYAVLAEEAGYALYPGPWWSTVALAGPVLGAPPQEPATLAWAEPGVPYLRCAGRATRTTATRDGGSWTLTGQKLRVPDLGNVATTLVVAGTPDGAGIWRVATRTADVRSVSTVDATRRLGVLTLDRCPGEVVTEPGLAADPLTEVRRRAVALLACEAVGITQRALDLSSAYAKERTQFGRAIGTFQGVSHRIADIFTALQLARSLAYRAVSCLDTGTADVDEAVTVAAVSAGEGAVFACESAMQAMGGIGFTWDHPLHRFYKRAQWIAAFDGTPRSRRAELAALLLGDPARAAG